MNIKVVLFSILCLVLIFQGLNVEAQNTHQGKRVPRKLDVKTPVVKLNTAYKAFISSFNIREAILLLLEILHCFQVLPLATTTTITSTPEIPVQYVAFSQLTEAQIDVIADKLLHVHTLPSFGLEGLHQGNENASFCDSQTFQNVHKFIWHDDQQLTDLVEFLKRFGYDYIYDTIKQMYVNANCTVLIGDLPPYETNPIEQRSIKQVNGQTSRSNVREQLLQNHNRAQEEPKCDILAIISKLQETGLLQLANFIQVVITEFNTSPDLHFLIGKIQEPIKGKSVRKFHNLQEIQGLLTAAHEKIKLHPVWSQLFQAIKIASGVDFFTINPFEFLFSLFEALVWGTIFPTPSGF